MLKREKIILVSKSGGGKDHLLRGLLKKGLRYSPKHTTRPKRNLETEGVEYNFISNFEFSKMLKLNEIKTHQIFSINDIDWYYGISSENFNNNQIFIMTPMELEMLSESDRKKSFVVFLDISEDIRRKRISKRNDNNDSIERRIKSDEEDFKNFVNYDLKITDPYFEIDMVYDLMD